MSERIKACPDTECKRASCDGCEKNPNVLIETANEHSSIKKVIGIVSGKGGVGKSLVTAMLSVMLNRKGYRTGIMDADITGSSIPKMFGLSYGPQSAAQGMIPQTTNSGIRIMSMNLLIEQSDAPVIWRGPLLSSAVKKFWTDVQWGELDFLLIDMPPGTGDIPLTVFQSIPLDGIIVVTSPQALVSMIVKKAFGMAKRMDIPVIGIIENMSYVKCPSCGMEISLFGKSTLRETADNLNLDILGIMPVDPLLANLADTGRIENFCGDYLADAAEMLEKTI